MNIFNQPDDLALAPTPLFNPDGFTYAFRPGFVNRVNMYAEEVRSFRLRNMAPLNSITSTSSGWPAPHLFNRAEPLPPPRVHRLWRLNHVLEDSALDIVVDEEPEQLLAPGFVTNLGYDQALCETDVPELIPATPPREPTPPPNSPPMPARFIAVYHPTPPPILRPQRAHIPRCVVINSIPYGTPLSSITPHIRGGRIERIVFSPKHNYAHVFFLTTTDAALYHQFVNMNDGIPWAGHPYRYSRCAFLSEADGGAEPVLGVVRRAVVEENACRVVLVEGVPIGLGVEGVRVEIGRRVVGVEFESVLVEGGRAIVKVDGVEGALEVRRAVGEAWRGCLVAWGVDECEMGLQGLVGKWKEVRAQNLVVLGARRGRRKGIE